MPGAVVAAFKGDEDFTGLTVTRAQAEAAVEHWRAKSIEGIEEMAARLRAEIAVHE